MCRNNISAGWSWPMTQQCGTNTCPFLPHADLLQCVFGFMTPHWPSKKFPRTEVDSESLIITLPSFPFPSARLPPGFSVSPWVLSSFLHRHYPSISHTFYSILVFLLRGPTQTQGLKAKYRFSIERKIISKYWNLVDYVCAEIFRKTCKYVCNLLLKASKIRCCDE